MSGNGSFGGAVGGQTALTSLGVTGTSALNGGTVVTTNGQTYSGTVTLGTTTTTLDTTNAPVTLAQVNGTGDTLDISTGSGGIIFNGLTLAALNLTTTGSETINGGTYSIGTGTYTFGTVLLNGNLVFEQATSFGTAKLGSNTTMIDSAGTVGFTGTLDGTTNGGQSLQVSGAASFGGAVGSGTKLASLGVTGTSALNGGRSRPRADRTTPARRRSAPIRR